MTMLGYIGSCAVRFSRARHYFAGHTVSSKTIDDTSAIAAIISMLYQPRASSAQKKLKMSDQTIKKYSKIMQHEGFAGYTACHVRISFTTLTVNRASNFSYFVKHCDPRVQLESHNLQISDQISLI